MCTKLDTEVAGYDACFVEGMMPALSRNRISDRPESV